MQKIEQPHQLGVIPTEYLDDFISISSEKVGGGHGASTSSFKVNGKELKVIQVRLGSDGDAGPFHYCLFECTNHYHCYIDKAEEFEFVNRSKIFSDTLKKLLSGENVFHWKTHVSIHGTFNHLLFLDLPLVISDDLRIDPSGFSVHSKQVFKPVAPFDPEQYSPFDDTVPGSASGTRKYVFELRLSGKESGKTWNATSVTVSNKLSKLAAFVSVYNNAIVNLDTPLTEIGSMPSGFDDSSSESRRVKHMENAEVLKHGQEMSDNWGAYISSKTLTDSFEMFSEGIKIENEHPSLAHVAYVSAIERIGSDISSPKTCSGFNGDSEAHCEHCMKISGAAAAYRAALKLTMSRKVAKSFFSQTYGKRRGKTVHEAVLHGAEPAGSASLIFSLVDDTRHFNFEVYRVREQAREILLKALEKHVESLSQQ